MKKLSVPFMLAFALISLASCHKCRNCSGVQEVYMDDTLVMKQSVSATEICDDQLKTIESNPKVTSTTSFGGMETKTVVTYTCD